MSILYQFKMYVFVADLLILMDVFEALGDVSMTQGKFEIDSSLC